VNAVHGTKHDCVLVLAPFARDAEVIARVLDTHSIDTSICEPQDNEALRHALSGNVGAVLLTAEAAKPEPIRAIVRSLGNEPLWSAPPVILLAENEKAGLTTIRGLKGTRDDLSVTVLIRPSSALEIASAVQTCLNVRRHQVEIRDLLQKYRAAEERAEFLFQELSHRVKNVFSMVSAIASLTERDAETSEAFRQSFTSRMSALSEAYDTMRDWNWESAKLDELVRKAVGSILTQDEQGRLNIDGPSVVVSSDHAPSLGLVLHELASNARKYGALSTDDGRITVSWQRTDDATIAMVWEEVGGPAVTPPSQEGFGQTVIKSSIKDSKVDLDYRPGGVVCRLEFEASDPSNREIGSV
jgi:two-component sensor histidine kinase